MAIFFLNKFDELQYIFLMDSYILNSKTHRMALGVVWLHRILPIFVGEVLHVSLLGKSPTPTYW